jgi:hypothetical protein
MMPGADDGSVGRLDQSAHPLKSGPWPEVWPSESVDWGWNWFCRGEDGRAGCVAERGDGGASASASGSGGGGGSGSADALSGAWISGSAGMDVDGDAASAVDGGRTGMGGSAATGVTEELATGSTG